MPTSKRLKMPIQILESNTSPFSHSTGEQAARPVHRQHWELLVSTVLAALIAMAQYFVPALVSPLYAATSTSFPAQFVAKTYTEALGRIPDQGGWNYAKEFFSSGCNVDRLRTWGSTVWNSMEFANLSYPAPNRTLTLYRGILNREPDPGGLDYYNHLSTSAAVSSLYSSPEFASLAARICSSTNYYFGNDGNPPIDIGYGIVWQDALQSQLNATPVGGTVYLRPGQVVDLNRTLTVPSGVTLATADVPDRYHYALMARLVRSNPDSSSWGSFPVGSAVWPSRVMCSVDPTAQYPLSLPLDPTVILQPGARLYHVWVDGLRNAPQRKYAEPDGKSAADVCTIPGPGTTQISDSRFDNAPGAQTIRLERGEVWKPCNEVDVQNNLVTAYSSDHKPVPTRSDPWTDGIFANCEHSYVLYNEVVDASDVAILVGNDSPYVIQQSKVQNNQILAAGNSAFAALAADPFSGDDQHPHSFVGTDVSNNTMWTGDDTLFDLGLAVGTRLFAFLGPGGAWGTGNGATFTYNWEHSSEARFHTSIAVSGMINATVTNNIGTNAVYPVLVDNIIDKCGGYFAAKIADTRYASGSLQPLASVANYQGCIGG